MSWSKVKIKTNDVYTLNYCVFLCFWSTLHVSGQCCKWDAWQWHVAVMVYSFISVWFDFIWDVATPECFVPECNVLWLLCLPKIIKLLILYICAIIFMQYGPVFFSHLIEQWCCVKKSNQTVLFLPVERL